MELINAENDDVAISKATRASRCRRAPLTNVTNVQSNKFVKTKHSNCSTSSAKVNQKSSKITDEPYTEDILQYMISREKELTIHPNYMASQPDLKPTMRCILIDWIIQACTKFRLNDETQYYAIQYIDRFLSRHKIDRGNLQLVGICSIFLAAKFEEIMVPSMSDLCFITEDTYTPMELERMEAKMLTGLEYNLSYPTSIQFLRFIVKSLTCTRQHYYYAKFLCELLTVSYTALKWRPSEIAISSIDITNKVTTYVPVLQQMNFDVEPTSIEQCKEFIRKIVLNDELSDYSAVLGKYEKVHKKLKEVLSKI